MEFPETLITLESPVSMVRGCDASAEVTEVT